MSGFVGGSAPVSMNMNKINKLMKASPEFSAALRQLIITYNAPNKYPINSAPTSTNSAAPPINSAAPLPIANKPNALIPSPGAPMPSPGAPMPSPGAPLTNSAPQQATVNSHFNAEKFKITYPESEILLKTTEEAIKNPNTLKDTLHLHKLLTLYHTISSSQSDTSKGNNLTYIYNLIYELLIIPEKTRMEKKWIGPHKERIPSGRDYVQDSFIDAPGKWYEDPVTTPAAWNRKFKNILTEVNAEGETPLMFACKYGFINIIKILLMCLSKQEIQTKNTVWELNPKSVRMQTKKSALGYILDRIREIEKKRILTDEEREKLLAQAKAEGKDDIPPGRPPQVVGDEKETRKFEGKLEFIPETYVNDNGHLTNRKNAQGETIFKKTYTLNEEIKRLERMISDYQFAVSYRELRKSYPMPTPFPYKKEVDVRNLLELYKLYKVLMEKGATAGGGRKTSKQLFSKKMRTKHTSIKKRKQNK